MAPKSPATGDGFVQEVLPLLKNGFIMLRSILDMLIERIEEAEEHRQVDIRKDTYLSIVDALEAEIENIRKEKSADPETGTRIEVLQAIISVLLREMEELDGQGRKKTKGPRKVKIQ
jgi:hypothetical protein